MVWPPNSTVASYQDTNPPAIASSAPNTVKYWPGRVVIVASRSTVREVVREPCDRDARQRRDRHPTQHDPCDRHAAALLVTLGPRDPAQRDVAEDHREDAGDEPEPAREPEHEGRHCKAVDVLTRRGPDRARRGPRRA